MAAPAAQRSPAGRGSRGRAAAAALGSRSQRCSTGRGSALRRSVPRGRTPLSSLPSRCFGAAAPGAERSRQSPSFSAQPPLLSAGAAGTVPPGRGSSSCPAPPPPRSPFFPSQHRGFAPPHPPTSPPFFPAPALSALPSPPCHFHFPHPPPPARTGSRELGGAEGRREHRTAPPRTPPRTPGPAPRCPRCGSCRGGAGGGGCAGGAQLRSALGISCAAPQPCPPRSPRRGPRRRCGIGAARTAPPPPARPPRAQTALSDRMRLKTPPRGFAPCGRRRGSRIRQNLWTGDGEPQGRKERDARNYHPAKPFQHIAAIATEMGCPSRSLQCNKGRERDAGKERAVRCAGQFPKGLAQTNSNWKQLEPIPPLPL